MDPFVMEIAGAIFEVFPLFETTRLYCRDYLCEKSPNHVVEVSRADLMEEQEFLDVEAEEEGLKKRKFADPFLERSVIQRKIASYLIGQGVLLMHGSTVAVGGRAYLFTASCGTGKSTHTRLWREVFGDRAVMVNDDKPFLRFERDGVVAYGSPWTGKHGLGANVSFPLAGICVLHRGPDNLIRRADSRYLEEFVRHQCFLGEEDPALVRELLRLVPLWEMECTKEPEAARVAFEAMSGLPVN